MPALAGIYELLRLHFNIHVSTDYLTKSANPFYKLLKNA